MFFCRLLAVAIISVLQIKSSELPPSKEECVNRLVESCNKADYSNYQYGSSIMSTTENSPSGGMVHTYCHSDVNGTTCYRNHAQWFSCTSDHNATYKGKILEANSTDGADDEVCYTSRRLASGNLGSVFVSPRNVTAVLEKNRETLHQHMDSLQERLSKINQPCFPFCDHNPFGPGFPFNR